MSARILIRVDGGVASVVASTVPVEVHVADFDAGRVGEIGYSAEQVPAVTEELFDKNLQIVSGSAQWLDRHNDGDRR